MSPPEPGRGEDGATAPAVVIRRAEVGDALPLAALITQLGYPTRAEEMTVRLRELLPREEYLVAVAAAQGPVVGVLAAQVGLYIEMNGRCGRVTALSVDENHRGRGVGALLLAHAEAWLRARGAAFCLVNSSTRRTRAHRFYAREGYRATGLRFEKPLAAVRPGPPEGLSPPRAA